MVKYWSGYSKAACFTFLLTLLMVLSILITPLQSVQANPAQSHLGVWTSAANM
jgi:hypothetical protein